jgi:hypothetical protein
MKMPLLAPVGMAAALALVAGCQSVPEGVERGPHGTVAYTVLIEASAPGAQIEANGKVIGAAPVRLKIFGDKDGTFHDFGAYTYLIRALPVATNQFLQVRVFRTGRWFTPEDRIPNLIYFDMNQPPAGVYYYVPPAAAYGPPVYHYATTNAPAAR